MNIRQTQNKSFAQTSYELVVLLLGSWYLFAATSSLMFGSKHCAEDTFKITFKCMSVSLEHSF